ncbi:Glycosyl hydrolase family 20, domain 2 [Saccharicrinis carchari]|uniref:Glycosyl hydrolase family 20, domain 2 n=1 Tax=Saccharicrinis carchari TaxID=1168039 RepID=A0A521CY53_SACCC|nr:DUF4838 domain-containing protein [Saccharicrinis carchari]SMO64342.1 Glycosyl hydrolase family 20, domain 2 [Saccharicrinis carchari]
MKKNILFVVLLLLGISTQVISQALLVKNNKANSRILLTVDDNDSKTAAHILQTFVEKMSGAKLPILTSFAEIKKNDVVIDNTQKNLPSLLGKSIKEDGFYLSSKDNTVQVVGGEGRGVIYAVVTLLENYFGIDYFGEHEYTFEKQPTLEVPLIHKIDNPAFRYRQTQSYAMRNDSLYKLWHRIEVPSEVFAESYWVHTFDKLLPSDQYGEEHPEYYSYFKGKRHPGKASQWCLTNPEVFEIVAQRIDAIFKANPDKNIISVSQNDGNYTNCTCDDCSAIDEHEEAFSGSLITFLNKLAVRFPDKEFSTLAYLYTMNPPKHIKPLPNVNIMLCDIDCMREVSLTENESGREFMKAMEGWSEISNNIFVWDYGINFDNFVAPFPNFHILQDNIRLFKKHNAQMHFSQIGGSLGGDFPELRAYLVSKLMWNPEVDVDSLMIHFLDGYYGEAGHNIYQYIKVMEGALIASGVPLWIYDSPVTHKNGMLKPELMRRYKKLWDNAEKAVANKETFLKRVQRSRLPLLYSELEIARTENEKKLDDINEKLDYFEKKVKEFKVPTLNERNNSPVEYCELYRDRYMPREEKSLALGAKVTYEIEPTGKYKTVGEKALTDGLFGGSTFVESWVGWEGIDGAFVVDLGENKNFHSVETDFLHQLGQWILFPLQVVYSYSQDGENYTHWETHDLPEDRSVSVKFKGVKSESPEAIHARYIKVEVVGTKVCPTWHYGVGHPSWFFIDEVTVL